ncbi:MAG: hypothetical protein Q9162_002447 [Coniocarpon cinnabarinum]
MASYIKDHGLEAHIPLLHAQDGWQPSIQTSLVLLVVAYVTWRLYRFTIIPYLYPHEAPELPYSIPFIGHARQFFTDADGLLTYGRNYFNNTRELFVLVIAGERLHVATNASDVATITKSPDFTFDSYMRDIMLDFSFTKPALDRMWERPGTDDKPKREAEGRFPNIGRKPLAKLAEDIIRRQLLPGSMFESIQEDVLRRFLDVVSWERIRDDAVLSSSPGEKTVSLKKWTQTCLIGPATEAFFGTALLRVAPDLLDHFCEFDEKSWKLTYKVPTVFSKDMHAARRQAHESLIRYFELPREERDDAAWVIKTIEDEMRALGIGSEDIAANLSMFYWVYVFICFPNPVAPAAPCSPHPMHTNINANSRNEQNKRQRLETHNQPLLTHLRSEIDPLITNTSSTSPVSTLQALRQNPHYTSFYNETLRTIAAGKTIRDVAKPTSVRGKTLKPGDRVLISFRQMLVSESVFGKDWNEFKPERFVEDDTPLKSESFRPFGAGASLCSGRYFAMSEILFFLGLVVSRFEMDVKDGEGMPELDNSRSSLGIMPPKEGHDCVVRMKPRRV